MVRAELGGAGVALALLLACGGGDHAPFIPITPDTGGNGSGAAPGDDSGASGGSAGAGAKPASGGKSGSDDDAGIPVDAPPWALTRFDQNEVYFFGQLGDTDMCGYHPAVARIEDPNKYAIGFTCATGLPTRMKISKHRLLYETVDGHEIRQFVPENVDPYPLDPYSNDLTLDTPCRALITGMVVTPSGSVIYHCLGLGWFMEGGGVVYSNEAEFVAMTDTGLAAIPADKNTSSRAGVMKLTTHLLVPVDAIENPWGIRAHDDTFHYIVGGYPPTLWSVDSTGFSTKLGDYAPPPPEVDAETFTALVLAPDDSLYETATDANDKRNVILYKVRIDGTSEIIFDGKSPAKVDGAIGGYYITGP